MVRKHLVKLVLAVEGVIIAAAGLRQTDESGDLETEILWILPPLVFTIVGGIVAWKRPDNRIGWIYLLPGGFLGLIIAGESLETLAGNFAPGLWNTFFKMLANLGWPGFLGTMFTLTWLYFPDGRLPSSRWRPVVWGVPLGIFLIALGDFINDLPPKPSLVVLEAVTRTAELILMAAAFGSFASLFYRYRRGREIERRQVRWIVSAAALIVLLLFLVIIPGEMLQIRIMISAGDILLPLAITLVPAAAGVAILRYRLFDIDLVIRRTLVYSVLSILLALLYFGTVTLLQNLVTAASGPFNFAQGRQQSPGVIVVSTLGIAALFTPLRRRVQGGIDRRFYRRKYDAEKALAAFGLSVRDEVDLETLSGALLAVIEETMQPERISLWLLETAALEHSLGAGSRRRGLGSGHTPG